MKINKTIIRVNSLENPNSVGEPAWFLLVKDADSGGSSDILVVSLNNPNDSFSVRHILESVYTQV